ncbi:DUF3613 domain-containing protein [Trinickia diaoshuihuensis]|uniref:DUF3613 domain-containing protein n=1 Tax=Trinickia diaoshuihuensis TaxID=2292265 RepID=UPI001F086F09|nr:DUF3613 domain-containing protein [Trinickia diaoshuihuensis]
MSDVERTSEEAMHRDEPTMNQVVWRAVTVALVLAGACATTGVNAQTTSGDDAAEIGRSTRAWLELQRTNAAAAPALPMPGAQATLAYERYMNSFRTRIPESFGSTLSGEGGAGRVDRWSAGSGAAQPPGVN